MAKKVDAAWPVAIRLAGIDADGDPVEIAATLDKSGKITVTSVTVPAPRPMTQP